MIEPAQIAQIEAVERDAWLDIYAAAAPPIRSALGIVQRRLDDGALLICRAIDHLQFNRLGYLGITAPARAEAVDPALADFDAAGVKNWIVHVAQGADLLNTLCAARGLTPHPRTWAKFIRDKSCRAGRRHHARDPRGWRRRRPRVRRRRGARLWHAAGGGRLARRARPASALALLRRFRRRYTGRGRRRVHRRRLRLLGTGATVGSHRKRGAQSALLAARINAVIAGGCTLLTTETGIPHAGEAAPSYANIQRAGFAVAYPRPNPRRA
jgi:hypothetical protein